MTIGSSSSSVRLSALRSIDDTSGSSDSTSSSSSLAGIDGCGLEILGDEIGVGAGISMSIKGKPSSAARVVFGVGRIALGRGGAAASERDAPHSEHDAGRAGRLALDGHRDAGAYPDLIAENLQTATIYSSE